MKISNANLSNKYAVTENIKSSQDTTYGFSQNIFLKKHLLKDTISFSARCKLPNVVGKLKQTLFSEPVKVPRKIKILNFKLDEKITLENFKIHTDSDSDIFYNYFISFVSKCKKNGMILSPVKDTNYFHYNYFHVSGLLVDDLTHFMKLEKMPDFSSAKKPFFSGKIDETEYHAYACKLDDSKFGLVLAKPDKNTKKYEEAYIMSTFNPDKAIRSVKFGKITT